MKFIFVNLCHLLVLIFLSLYAHGQRPPKFIPPSDKLVLVIGQNLGAIGGFSAPNNNGYIDHVSIRPGGVTTYTSIPSLNGLRSKTNYGSGDISAQSIIENPAYYNSALAIGLYMVNQLQFIANGTYDTEINSLGKWIKEANRPVFLRIGYEFDGNWNNYHPVEYQKAFRRIVTLFDSIGVKNCAYVWQACTSPVDDLIENKHEDIAAWYPGDDYVDYMGYSWFLNSEAQHKLTDELLDFARAHKKPVMLCEAAPQGYDIGNLTKRNISPLLDGPSGLNSKNKKPEEIWNEWFVPFFTYIEKNKDVIKVVAYINANWDAQPMWGPPYKQGYWGDSRIEANDVIKKKWLEVISQDRWLHASPSLFNDLGFKREQYSPGYRSR